MSTAPNILWICSDLQRHDTLGCYGNRHVRTPRIIDVPVSKANRRPPSATA